MKYVRDIDYFIYAEDFPHRGVVGVIVANSDGTANIYINTLYSPERQARALRHELRHLAKNHLWTDTKIIVEKELEADTEDPSIIFGKNFSYVEYINKETSTRHVPQKEEPRMETKPEPTPIEFTHSLPYSGDTLPIQKKQMLLGMAQFMQTELEHEKLAVNE